MEEVVIFLSTLYYEQGKKSESVKLIIQALTSLHENELLMDQIISFYNKIGDYVSMEDLIKRKQNYLSNN